MVHVSVTLHVATLQAMYILVTLTTYDSNWQSTWTNIIHS